MDHFLDRTLKLAAILTCIALGAAAWSVRDLCRGIIERFLG